MTGNLASLRIAAALALAAAVLPRPARAATPGAPGTASPAAPRVAELLKSGEARYGAGDFAAALADFEAADARPPTAEAARSIGLCQDKLGRYQAAAAAYHRFLAHPPPKLVDEVGVLVARLHEIEQMPGKVLLVASPPGASLTIDGRPEKQKTPYEALLAPGKHIVRASAPEHEALEREVDIAFASTQEVTLTLTAAPAPPQPVVAAPAPAPPPPQIIVPKAPPPPAVTRRTVAFAAAGVAVVGAGLATTFGVLALHNKSSFQSSPTLTSSDNGNNDAAYADGAIALSVAAGVTSLVLFLTDESSTTAEPPRTRPAKLSGAPFLTPHGAGAGALVRF